MGEEFRPQEGPPNSFLQYLDNEIGKRLGRFLEVQIATYEQERFERNVIYARATVTGGGAATFNFDLEGVGSYIVKEVHVVGELASERTWSVNSFKTLLGGAQFEFQRAKIALQDANASAQLVGGNWGGTATVLPEYEFYTSPEFICWRGVEGFADQFFNVEVDNVTAAQAVVVHAVLEEIPGPSQLRDMSNAVLVVT